MQNKINKNKSKKRILSVTIKREIDTDPDTSWLGEYSSKCTSEFSIDRMHREDCAVNNRPTEAIDKLERIIYHIQIARMEEGLDAYSGQWETFDESIDTLIALQGELEECDCGEHGDMRRGTYRYFNPSFNYVDKDGHALKENTAEEVRKYVRQGYERMESLNSGQWCFLSINAEAQVSIPCGESSVESTVGLNWCSGYESDMGKSGMEEVEADHLSELRAELKALGFSIRAISTAFKNVKRTEE